MAVLGDDGHGYNLAMKLEHQGVWRTWLGDTLYSAFIHSLSSPSSWHSFMSSTSTSDLHLQLRVRALLFDKASFSLFLPSSSSSSLISKLNPSYLQLHGDDVYFTLEDAAAPPRDSKVSSQRFRQEVFPETWYHQFFENYRASRPYMLSSGFRESDERSPTGMSNYLKLLERHKRRRVELKEADSGGFGSSNSENMMQRNAMLVDDTPGADDTGFFPETMFMMNCVPDSVVAPRSSGDEKLKVDFNGVLDTLPKVVTKSSSSIMLERLGIRPEFLSMEQGAGQSHTRIGFDGNRRQLGEEQAMQMSKKVVARMLTNVGFEGATEIPVEVLSQFLSCHISKLGRILKVLADSYRKQCSATELIKMFLQAGGHSLSSLAEHVKDTRPVLPQTPHQIQSPQSQLASSQHNFQLPQQVPRQMHPQIPQMVRPHNLNQQQLELLRRRHASSPRGIMSMDKDRPMVEVKLENPPELPMDSNALNAINSRQAQMQWRQQQQQQIAALQRFGHQIRQPTSIQIPQMQSPNIGAVRAQPVKVEGFQELMGGDTSTKQNTDENKLTSPSK
ncbi:hypothetical protein RND81_11G236600 [Saponaria officinalis]|uniref:Bromodomain associated domain-containing protein n=1 Tax=Saponaria officinalis TaxID=3572 RepID=A0AAW1HR55_SAPOF